MQEQLIISMILNIISLLCWLAWIRIKIGKEKFWYLLKRLYVKQGNERNNKEWERDIK